MSEPKTFLDGRVTLRGGDCREVIRSLPDAGPLFGGNDNNAEAAA